MQPIQAVRYVDLSAPERGLILALRAELESHVRTPVAYTGHFRVRRNLVHIRIETGLVSQADGDNGIVERIVKDRAE